MIKPICRNLQILAQKARPATKQDIPLAKDLLETLAANSADCVGMAANMIGAPVAVIAVSLGPVSVAMLNPKLTSKKSLTRPRKAASVLMVSAQQLATSRSSLNILILTGKNSRFH